jgi:hypothetical protein
MFDRGSAAIQGCGFFGAQRRYMPPVARSAIRLKRLGAAR